MGLFASRDIRAGELITLYPGDALLYWKGGREAAYGSGRICSGVIFGAHIPQEEKDADRVTTTSAREYEMCASSTISCVGDPRLNDDPAYMGHFTNDGAMCESPERASAYRKESLAAANADHVTLEGCQIATQATRDIISGDEILVTYGGGYWLSHLIDVDGDVTSALAEVARVDARGVLRRQPALQPTNPTSPRQAKGFGKGKGRGKKKSKGKLGRKDAPEPASGGAGRLEAGVVTPPESDPTMRARHPIMPIMTAPPSAPQATNRFTSDVDAATGLCSDGRVRIGPSKGKGLGAFAVDALLPLTPSNGEGLVRGEHQIGEYRGEVYTLDGLRARYGKDGSVAADDAEWHAEWSAGRQAKGVGVTGGYVFTVSDALDPYSEVLYIDAEDPEHALWTRYINHSGERPNLSVRSSNGLSDARTTLRLVVNCPIEAGDELLIDYGPRYAFETPAVE